MSNLYLISGSDEYTIRQKANELIIHLCGANPEDNPGLEIIHGDNTDLKPAQMIHQIINSIKTRDLFGGQKTIWLKRFDFKDMGKNKILKEATVHLSTEIKNGIPDDIVIVLDGVGIDKRSALFKTCQSAGSLQMIDKIDVKSKNWAQDIRIKIQQRCELHNIKITPNASMFLSEIAGTDSGRVVTELDKLFAYIEPRDRITIEDCQAICSITPEIAGWAFSNALSDKDLPAAIEALNILFNNKTFGIAVLYTVMSAFQNMIKVKVEATALSLDKNLNANKFQYAVGNVHPELKEKLKNGIILKSHPYRAFMLFSQANKFSDAKLADTLNAILDVNKKLVSGGGDPQITLELLAAKICN